MSKLIRRWIFYCAAGELFGISIAASINFYAFSIFGDLSNQFDEIIILGFVIIAALIEGIILGVLQWKVLVRFFPNMKIYEWVFWTSVAAILCWILGTIPTLFIFNNPPGFEESNTFNQYLFLIFIVVSGLVLGAILGLFQSFSLKKHTSNSIKWIYLNIAGWLIGLSWIYLIASIPTEDSSIYFIIVLGIIAGVIAGTSVGLITSIFFINLKPTNQRLAQF